jgi:hypothetical protein
MHDAALIRASWLLDALDATITELREREDPRNDEFIEALEEHRRTLLRQLSRLEHSSRLLLR